MKVALTDVLERAKGYLNCRDDDVLLDKVSFENVRDSGMMRRLVDSALTRVTHVAPPMTLQDKLANFASDKAFAKHCSASLSPEKAGIAVTRASLAVHESVNMLRDMAFSLHDVREYHQYRRFGYAHWETFCIEILHCSHNEVNRFIRHHMTEELTTTALFSVPAGDKE